MNDNNHGYTLVELMTVLCILGFTCQFGILSLNSWQSRIALEKAAEQLASDVIWVRQIAANEKKHYSFRVTPGSQYPFYVVYDRMQVIKKEFYPVGIYSHYNNFANSGGLVNEFVFSTTGQAGRPNLGGHIGLTDGKGNFRYVIISQQGRVRISKTPPQGSD